MWSSGHKGGKGAFTANQVAGQDVSRYSDALLQAHHRQLFHPWIHILLNPKTSESCHLLTLIIDKNCSIS